jgi:hypothetical protein
VFHRPEGADRRTDRSFVSALWPLPQGHAKKASDSSGRRANGSRGAVFPLAARPSATWGRGCAGYARLRQQARDWLRADLEAWCRALEKMPDKTRPVVVHWMQHWLNRNRQKGKQKLGRISVG